MNRAALALAMALLAIPPVGAIHDGLPPIRDDGPVVETGVVPIDRSQEDALALVDEVLDTAGDTADDALAPVLEIVDDTLGDVGNAIEDANRQASELSPALYSDGTGQDPATGVLGPWRQIGHDAWRLNPGAFRTGAWGISSDAPEGFYPATAESLLLTPEMDLRTGAVESGLPGGIPVSGPQSSVLRFWVRSNLAAGLDGVDLWMMNPQGVNALKAGARPMCGPGCAVVTETDFATNGYTSATPVQALGGPGFTGPTDWTEVTMDLGRWSDPNVLGPRLWLGFHFASVPRPAPGYFEDPTLFDPALEWYGLQLDDLRLTAPMSAANLQVHELDKPAQTEGRPEPTFGLYDPIPVRAAIRNTGRTTLDGMAVIQVVGLPSPYVTTVNVTALGPGRVLFVDALFPALGENATLVARVSVQAMLPRQAVAANQSSPPVEGSDAAVSASLRGGVPGRLSANASVEGVGDGVDREHSFPAETFALQDIQPDTVSGDNQRTQAFRVLLLRSIEIDGPTRQGPWVDRGEPFSAKATVTNQGTQLETVTLAARLIDARTGKDATDLLSEEMRFRTIELGPLESMDLTWPIPTLVPGQYRFFVRTLDMPDYPLCVGTAPPTNQIRIPVPYRENEITIDQKFAAGEAWDQVPFIDLEFDDGEGGSRPMRMRTFHDGESLYFALEVPDSSQALPGSDDEDRLFLAFDDRGDGSLLDGEDGLAIADENGLTGPIDDLAYRPADLSWESQGTAEDDAGRIYEPSQQIYRMELRRALAGTDPDALHALPGSQVGLYMELANVEDGVETTHRFPPGGVVTDGEGIGQRDNNLDDETASWAVLVLAPTTVTAAFGDCGITDGFGIGMGPPLAFLFDPATDCPDGLPAGWASAGAEGIDRPGVDGVDGWGCSYYRPEGRTLLYEGMQSASTCAGLPCPQVSAAGTIARVTNTIDKVLVTPPIAVPDSASPSLILQHQYSTLVRFRDDVIDDQGNLQIDTNPDISIPSAAWVRAQVADAAGEFPEPGTDEILLVPASGAYSTLANTLPFDSEGMGRVFEVTSDANGRTGLFCGSAFPPVKNNGPSCGWWAPAGRVPGYRAPGEQYPLGGEFTGSPWKIDRLPLSGMAPNLFNGYGDTEGEHSVDLRGKLVRFLFYFSPAQFPNQDPLDPSQSPAYDFGWRIGTIAVDESSVAVVDAALTDLRVGDVGYDPDALGFGPGTSIPFEANVTNLGLRPLLGDAAVSWRVRDANTTDPDHDGCRPRCEWEAGTDPLDPDTDDDGVLDGAEVGRGTNATKAGASCARGTSQDEDADCLADPWEEQYFGSLEAVADSDPDADGCSNACEQRIGAQPQNPDSDGDGALDGLEADAGTNPNSHPETPRPDCIWPGLREAPTDDDEDCLSDVWELEHFSRVADPDEGETAIELQRVSARGLDLLCEKDAELGVALASGDQAPVGFSCALPPHSEGAVAATLVTVRLPSGDDLPLNDQASLRAVPIHARVDGSIVASASPTLASAGFARTLRIEVRNEGNVPLPAGFGVQQSLLKGGLPGADDKAWKATTTVPIGSSRVLHELATQPEYRATDRTFKPSAGDWALVATLTGLDGDIDRTNDVALAGFQARQTFYGNDFGTPPKAASIVPDPLRFNSPWETFTDPLDDSGATDRVLRAGDPRTGELPTAANASAILPRLDLRGARSASIALVHDYDLEEGYDGARLEISADGGATWEGLVPSDAQQAAPRLVGANPLADVEGPVFTGASLDPDGAPTDSKKVRITSEFDLSKAKSLQQDVEFERFSTAGLTATPDCNIEQRDGTRYCAAAGWGGWLVENVTLNEPRPYSGGAMWWSGSAGPQTRQHVGYVGTGLRVVLNLSDERNGEQAVARWSEWRAGWQDLSLVGQRPGTGGTFEVFVEDDRGRTPQAPRVVATRPDGWEQRELSLSEYLGKQVTLEFHYTSSPRSQENNEGWFLDDLSAVRYLLAGKTPVSVETVLPLQTQDEPGFVSVDCGGKDPFEVTTDSGLGPDLDATSEACWSVVPRQESRPGGWHLETIPDGPGGTPASVWRMAGPEDQGYPNQANTRLITPMVDLRQVAGEVAVLQFQHRFGFEVEDPDAEVLNARDGGVVEVQEYDPATDSFGPWRLLTNGTVPPRLVLRGHAQTDRLTGMASAAAFEGTGYNAVFGRGTFAEGNLLERRPGVGAALPPMASVCLGCHESASGIVSSYPVTPVFSGDSGGWSSAAWDISDLVGQRVRFAFHAWTNPVDVTRPGQPLEGWTIGDIAVSGAVFSGKEVALRLRVGTDGTARDGQWSIDEMDIAGALYQRKVGLTGPDEDVVRIAAADSPDLPFRIENLGTLSRTRIALGVTAESLEGDLVAIGLVGASLAAVPLHQLGQAQVAQAWGPIALAPGGSADLTLRVLEGGTGPVRIAVRLLEDRNLTGTVPAYGEPLDEAAGASQGSWVVDHADVATAELLPAGPGRPALLEVERESDGVSLSARLGNNGTVASAFDVEWSLWNGEVLEWAGASQEELVPGEVVTVEQNIPIGTPGTYEARLAVSVSGDLVATTSARFPFQRSFVLWSEDFNEEASGEIPAEWSRAGSGDGDAAFRVVKVADGNGLLVWGGEPGSAGYCALLDDCARPAEGEVKTGPIDLTSVQGRDAIIDLAHAVSFSPRRDGAVLDATVLMPLSSGWTPQPCGGAIDWVRLTPTEGLPYTGLTSPVAPTQGGNPLGARVPVFQGEHGGVQTTVGSSYRLSEQPVWCPSGNANPVVPEGGLPLAGQVIALRYHTGVMAGIRPDREGWRIDTTRISSGSVLLGPRSDDGTLPIPLHRNVPKTYDIEVTNDASTWQTFDASIEAPGEWAVELDTAATGLRLAPGAQGKIRLAVAVPETAAAGRHMAMLTITSRESGVEPVVGRLPIAFDVDPLPKPDLSVLAVVVEQPDNIEAGKVIPVFARVANAGAVISKEAPVVFTAIDRATGQAVPFEVRTQKPLCAAGRLGCQLADAEASVAAEWSVPPPGEYRLVATIDPEQRLLDRDRANNAAWLDVTVKPLQLPDLVVGPIKVEGVGPAGLVEQGSLLSISVLVRNVGPVAIESSQARIEAGTLTLADVELPFLDPGENFTVTATKVASGDKRGQLLLGAQVQSTSTAESRVDNNAAKRLLTILRHDIDLIVPPKAMNATAGKPVMVQLTIDNRGNGVERVNLTVLDLPEGWKARLSPNATKVPPGGVALVALTATPPANAQGGDWRVNVTAKAERQTVNRSIAFQVDPRSLPPEVALHENATETGRVNLTVAIRAYSNVREEARIMALSGSVASFDPVRVLLEPGRTTLVPVAATLPGATPAGPAEVRLGVKPTVGNWSVESRTPMEVLPTLRGSVRWTDVVAAPLSPRGQRSLDLIAEVSNAGNVPFDASMEGEVADGILTPPRELRLEPGQTATVAIEVLTSEAVAQVEGSMVLRLASGALGNRSYSFPLPEMMDLPDLSVDAVNVAPQAGGAVEVSARVRNGGPLASPACLLHVYIDGRLAALVNVPPLASGEQQTVSGLAGMPRGEHTVSVIVDGDGVVAELHEDNNGRSTLAKGGSSDEWLSLGIPTFPATALLVVLFLAVLVRRRRP